MVKTWRFAITSSQGRTSQTIDVTAVTFDAAWRKVKFQLTNAELNTIATITQTLR